MITGCFIGTVAVGTVALGNETGVYLEYAAGTRIGGPQPAARNLIPSNGVDLDNPGTTPNDEDDPDEGVNTHQNYPEIETATSTAVTGTLNSTPNQRFVPRLFSNPGAQNEGKFFEEGPLVVTTDAEGNASFAFTPDPPIPAGRTVTATATNHGGSTSEFSAVKEVAAS
jgi:hypothetical protein